MSTIKCSAGDIVLVYWMDDGHIFTVGKVIHTYRGHRNQIYMVRMLDGEIDKVYDFQIISKY